MEFRVLRYFLAAVQEGNISKAAAFLNVTQPTLSRQLKDLEEQLGKQLFIRGSHNISLTTEGMILRKRAEEIIELVTKTEAEINTPSQTVAGDIYIGSGETRGMRLIAELIKGLRKKYPEIRYHLYSGNAENVTERLDKGLLDFGILIQPTDLSKYNTLTLPVKDTWGVIMSNSCALARKKSVTRQDLKGLPLICSQQAVGTNAQHNEFKNWFGKDFTGLNIIATYNLVFNAAIMAEQNIGYVISLDKLVDGMANNVCFRPLEPTLESSLNIVWKKHQLFSPAADIFLKHLQKKFSPRV